MARKRPPKKKAPPAPKKRSAKINTLKAASAAIPEATLAQNGNQITAVVSSGSESLGTPVFLPPANAHAIITNLVSRDQVNPKESLEPLSPTITGLKALVDKMALGEDIGEHSAHIKQVAANQPEKGDVVRAYVNQANHELIADLVEMRGNSVRHIKRASRRDDVSVSEALVIWRMCNDQLPDLTRGLTENDRAVDTTTVIEKIDYKRQQVERKVQKHWEGTTPQGRELIRKKLWELKREIQQSGSTPVESTVSETDTQPSK